MTEDFNASALAGGETFTCRTEDETLTLAANFARRLVSAGAFDLGTVIFLKGELGAGKSVFARGFIRALLPQARVKSPTYTLMEPYDTPQGPICHWDLYRLCDPEELAFIAGREIFSPPCIHLIEWADHGAGWLPSPHWMVTLQPLVEEHRCVKIEKLA